MQKIGLLKIPGNWKDQLYISRNTYKSAFHQAHQQAPSGLLWVFQMSAFTLSPWQVVSLHAPDASEAVELPGSQPRRFRKGKSIIISEAEHNMDEVCLPRRLVAFLPKDTQNLGTRTVGCKSPVQGLQGNGGQVPVVQYNHYSSSQLALQPGSGSPTTRSRSNENTSSLW